MPYSTGPKGPKPGIDPRRLRFPLLRIQQQLHQLRYAWRRQPDKLRRILLEDPKREWLNYRRSWRYKRPRPRAAERRQLYDEWLFNEIKQRQDAIKQLQELAKQILKSLSEVEAAISQLEAQVGQGGGSMVARPQKDAASLRKEVETEANFPANSVPMRHLKWIEDTLERRRRKRYPRTIYKKPYNPRASSNGRRRSSSSSRSSS